MTHNQADKRSENGSRPIHRPDPEVLPKAKRRIYTARYKLWVLEEADKCREQPGQVGALLRREGLYSSHLTTWGRQRDAGQMAGLKPQKRGRKGNEEEAEMTQLRRENKRLTRQLEQAELIIEAQKNSRRYWVLPWNGRRTARSEGHRGAIGAENKHETGLRPAGLSAQQLLSTATSQSGCYATTSGNAITTRFAAGRAGRRAGDAQRRTLCR